MDIKYLRMKDGLVLKWIFLLTILFQSGLSGKDNVEKTRLYFSDFQTPFSFFNTVPVRIKTTEKIDLSFSVNNEFVSQYRYRIEVPDPGPNTINKSLISWSAWISNAFVDIIIFSIDREGRYRLAIEYKSFSSPDVKRFEKGFEVYNPGISVINGNVSKTVSKQKNPALTQSESPAIPEEIIKPDYDKLLSLAIEKKDSVMFRTSIMNGAQVNLKGLTGGNIFHILNDNLANESIISLLKNKGISINEKDNYGNTPLHIAIMSGEHNYAKSLINLGAELNIKNSIELTPLHIAAFLNEDDIAKNLLGKGADINIKGNSGYTPLHIAALMNNISIAKDLLIMGADNKSKTNQKLTPGEIARIQNNYFIERLVSKKGSYNLNNINQTYENNAGQMNSVRLSPQFDINLPYNKELLKKRKLNRIVRFISVPVFVLSTAGTVYLRAEADNYYSTYKNAETREIAKYNYDLTSQYDKYAYMTGGVSLVSAFEYIISTIRKKNLNNKIRKTLY